MTRWTYHQRTGLLTDRRVSFLGYSGAPGYVNDPSAQNLRGLGPLPVATYIAHAPVDTEDHGPYVLRLEPKPGSQMFGRSGFLMHGDSKAKPGTASEGCMIQGRAARETVWNSDCHEIDVIND